MSPVEDCRRTPPVRLDILRCGRRSTATSTSSSPASIGCATADGARCGPAKHPPAAKRTTHRRNAPTGRRRSDARQRYVADEHWPRSAGPARANRPAIRRSRHQGQRRPGCWARSRRSSAIAAADVSFAGTGPPTICSRTATSLSSTTCPWRWRFGSWGKWDQASAFVTEPRDASQRCVSRRSLVRSPTPAAPLACRASLPTAPGLPSSRTPCAITTPGAYAATGFLQALASLPSVSQRSR